MMIYSQKTFFVKGLLKNRMFFPERLSLDGDFLHRIQTIFLSKVFWTYKLLKYFIYMYKTVNAGYLFRMYQLK